MSDSRPGTPLGLSGRLTAALTGMVILLLALGALVFPAHKSVGSHLTLLVLDPAACLPGRVMSVYDPLGRFMGEVVGQTVTVRLATNLSTMREALADEPEFVLCPDGVGIDLPGKEYSPLVVGRRSAPQNLRPRSVLVYRKAAGLVPTPWVERSGRTVIGDSLSLAGTGAWRRHDPLAAPSGRGLGPVFGPDPYDHAPVLHALRLGGFDYAVVRQWDADRFLRSGLLSSLTWGVEVLSPPVPDLMLLVSRQVPARRRLILGDHLSALGRNPEGEDLRERDLTRGLAQLHLVGFNLLLEPDFDLVRRNYPGHWPPDAP